MIESFLSAETDRNIRTVIKHGIRKWKHSLKSLGLIKKKFYCDALFAGRHAAILSDGTVVCSCFSARKEVVLGNLKENSFQDIWSGKDADNLRAVFRRGAMPSHLCAVCRYFVLRDPNPSLYDEICFPVEVHIENYAGCNLNCLACDRVGILRSRDELKLDTSLYKKIIDEISSKKELKRLNLIGNGEPFMADDFFDFITYAKTKNRAVSVHTSTNGLLLDSDDKREKLISSGLDTIEFSIHGSSQETYGKYHRGGDFEKAISNMRSLLDQKRVHGIDQKPFVVWKYILFTWNDSDEAVERAIEISKEIGVDRLTFALTRSPLMGFSRKYLPFRNNNFKKIEQYLTDEQN